MGFTECNVPTNVIGNLGTSVAERGLTTQQFKDKFDEMPEGIINYLNNTLIPQLNNSNVLRQAIINGNFNVNQRAVSGTVTLAAGKYGHDRWKAGASGCTYTFATSNGVTTITITAGSLQQVIEGVNLISGTYTLSWTGTAQGKIGEGSYGDSGITGSVTGGSNLTVEFGTGTLSKVQLNYGDFALPFAMRSFDEELRMCQRYFRTSYNYGTAIGTPSSFIGMVSFITRNSIEARGREAFNPIMRTTPTLTLYNPLTGEAGSVRSNGVNYGNSTSVNHGMSGICSISSTIGGFTGGQELVFHYTAECEL